MVDPTGLSLRKTERNESSSKNSDHWNRGRHGRGRECGCDLGSGVDRKTAVAPWEQWDGENWPVNVASEVKESKRDLVSDRKLHKSISQTDLFGINAAEQAIAQSGFAGTPGKYRGRNCGGNFQ